MPRAIELMKKREEELLKLIRKISGNTNSFSNPKLILIGGYALRAFMPLTRYTRECGVCEFGFCHGGTPGSSRCKASDTDGGKNVYQKGTCSWKYCAADFTCKVAYSETDECIGTDKVYELYPHPSIPNYCTGETIACPSGYKCSDGRCIKAEVCNDGIDNDGDGLIDCADPDCAGKTGLTGACCRSDSDCYYFGYDPITHLRYYCDCPNSDSCSISGSSYTCKTKGVCYSGGECENGYCCYSKERGGTGTCVRKGSIIWSGGKTYLCATKS